MRGTGRPQSPSFTPSLAHSPKRTLLEQECENLPNNSSTSDLGCCGRGSGGLRTSTCFRGVVLRGDATPDAELAAPPPTSRLAPPPPPLLLATCCFFRGDVRVGFGGEPRPAARAAASASSAAASNAASTASMSVSDFAGETTQPPPPLPSPAPAPSADVDAAGGVDGLSWCSRSTVRGVEGSSGCCCGCLGAGVGCESNEACSSKSCTSFFKDLSKSASTMQTKYDWLLVLPLTAPLSARRCLSRRTNAAFVGRPAVAAIVSTESCTAMASFSRQPDSRISFCTVSNCRPRLFINEPIASNANAFVSIAEISANGCCNCALSSIAFTFSTTCAFCRRRSCLFFRARIELPPPVEDGGKGSLAENNFVSSVRPS